MRGLLFLLAIVLLTISCEEDAFFTVPEGHSKIFALSEISPTSKIKVQVSTTIGVNTDDEFTFPKQSDAIVRLYENGEMLETPAFRYISSERAFVSQGNFRPEPGKEYGLSVEINDNTTLLPIYATTVIPEVEDFENVHFRNLVEVDFLKNKRAFTLDADFSFEGMEHNYFLIRPFWKNDLGDLIPLQVRPVTKGKEGCIYSSFNDAILVDAYKSQREISFKIESVEFLDTKDRIEDIELEVTAITQEAYHYYNSHSKLVHGQSTVLVEPVITYSNFENGLGLFTGYSSSVKTFKIR